MLSVLKFHCTSIRTSYRVVRVLYLLLSCFHALGGGGGGGGGVD